MNTREAAEYCGVTLSILLYVVRRDGLGTKIGGRWFFTKDELDRVFGGSAAKVARLISERDAARVEIDRRGIKIATLKTAIECSIDALEHYVTAIQRNQPLSVESIQEHKKSLIRVLTNGA